MQGQEMKHKLRYSAKARKDLDEIWDYIIADLGNPIAVEKTVNRIMDDIGRLAEFPEMGMMLRNATHMVTDYRYIVSGNYMAFYRMYDNTVYIVRILYGRRDYMRVLFGDASDSNISQ